MNAWALPKDVHEYLRRRLPHDSTVLELGSGAGTAELVRMFKHVYTVEHDERFYDQVEGAHYIKAPIADGWYSRAALTDGLPPSFDGVIVDGPPGLIGRGGILKHMDLFGTAPMVIDDVQRQAEMQLAYRIAAFRSPEPWSVHSLPDGRAFATIGWEL